MFIKKSDLEKIKHNLLRKQLDRVDSYVGKDKEAYFLSLIDEAYVESDKERRLSEHTMDVMSEELMEANQDLLKQTEELKKTQERYSLAAEAANDGLWDWDLEKGTVYYSNRWREMLSIPKNIELNEITDWYKRIHPHHVKDVKSAIENHLKGDHDRIEVEYKIKTETGRYIWAHARGLASRDETGKPVRVAGSQTDITVRKDHEQALFRAAFHDELTGLPNRALFVDRLSQVIEREKRLGEKPAAVLFIDLDRFKYINDTMGHEYGDEVLKNVAKILKNNMRSCDTVSRLGGDEFTILLDSVDDLAEASEIANRLLPQLNRSYEMKGREVFISASIGLTLVDCSVLDAESILRNADLAMYHAKTSGKARLEIFDHQQHERVLQRMQTESDLRKVVSRGELEVYYQPIIDLKTGKIRSFEALLRWFHPEKGEISPAQFIPLAEEVGLIGGIGQKVIEEVCDQVKEWVTAVGKSKCPKVSANLSVSQLIDDRHFDKLYKRIKNSTKSLDHLLLEITESVIMTDSGMVLDRLEKLSKLGLGLCIDDFGTGYSSLSYLHSYPYDVLKIDRSFITLITCDKKSERLVSSIIGLAKDLGLETVAEGIETEAQMKKLQELGCDLGQGFFFSKALTRKKATNLIVTQKTFPVEPVKSRRNLEKAS